MPSELTLWTANLWLASLAITAVLYFVSLIRNSDYDLWESCLYLPTYLMGRLVWRVHFLNAPPVEITRGAILVANHKSSVDPFFVQLAARRRVHWMVAKEYCEHFIFGPILKAVQAIPTNRSGMDTASTKLAMRITREGRLVGMFPEGQLNHTAQPLVPIRSGAALVAIRSGVPIIPLYILGSPYRREVWSPIFMPAHVSIRFGTPIFPSTAMPEHSAADETNIGTEQSTAPNANNTHDLVESDSLILEWGKQIVQMAGMPDFQVELASKRRRRRASR